MVKRFSTVSIPGNSSLPLIGDGHGLYKGAVYSCTLQQVLCSSKEILDNLLSIMFHPPLVIDDLLVGYVRAALQSALLVEKQCFRG